jgi:hypothetical protein
MNRKVLPTTRLKGMIPGHAPFEHNRRSVTFFALAYKILAGVYFVDVIRQFSQDGYIAAIKGRVLFQLLYQSIASGHLR